jgi:uncharacterized membrane protein
MIMNKKTTTFQLVSTALMAALVFVSNYLSFSIPVSFGSPTRIHLANVFCVLSGLLLGPVSGGLSAGIGSFLFDLTDPQYIALSPFTFASKFMLAFVAAKIAYSRGNKADNTKVNIVAAIAGSLTYIVLYLGETFIYNSFMGLPLIPNLTMVWIKFGASAVNAVIAVVISVPLCIAIKKALRKSNLLEKMQ